MLSRIKDFTITQKEKAVYAFVVGAIGSYMAQNGLSWKQVLTVAGLKALFVGVVSHQFVYWVENSQIEAITDSPQIDSPGPVDVPPAPSV